MNLQGRKLAATYSDPFLQHGTDSDEGLILYGHSVQHSSMAHCHIFADAAAAPERQTRSRCMVLMQYATNSVMLQFGL